MSTSPTHNAIVEVGGKDHAPMHVSCSYVRWKSQIRKKNIATRPNHDLITCAERIGLETYSYVSDEKKKLIDAEAEAVHIILTVIENDIYSTVNACSDAKEMRKAIEHLMQGENINKQDVETNLFWAFGKFTSRDRELLKSYYSRFYKRMNEPVRNDCEVSNHQVNF
nr:UBN2 domain-containing protein [Tanacetum cinerariifolium]